MAKPVVDGLEKKWQGKLEVAHVDANDEANAEITQRYGISALPAFVLLDPAGNVLYRQVGGRPDTAKIEAAITSTSP